jgi:hypothetical protein
VRRGGLEQVSSGTGDQVKEEEARVSALNQRENGKRKNAKNDKKVRKNDKK